MSKPEQIVEVSQKLDQVIALLRIIARKEIENAKTSILSTSKKEQIYNLCDGSTEMGEIAKRVGISGEYLRLTIRELEDSGVVIVKEEGKKRFPKKVI